MKKHLIQKTWHLRHRNLAKVTLAMMLAGLWLVSCKDQPSSTRAESLQSLVPVQVRVKPAEIRSVVEVEELVGTVRAKLSATVESKTSGRIMELPVGLGQPIIAGQLLARLESPEVNARLMQAEAGFLQAEREWKRSRELLKQNAVPNAVYDSAHAQYLGAKALLAEAQAMLGYMEIHAPFDGVVTRKWLDVGDLAYPGKPLLEIEDPSLFQLEADLPETVASNIQKGAQLTLRSGEGDREFMGTVAEIAPVVDPASRTFRVILDLPKTPGWRSGQFARLVVPVGETSVLRIPTSAVIRRGQMELVFVVEDQKARLRLIKSGQRLNDEIEILSGLVPGEMVVTENADPLVDGQRLRTR